MKLLAITPLLVLLFLSVATAEKKEKDPASNDWEKAQGTTWKVVTYCEGEKSIFSKDDLKVAEATVSAKGLTIRCKDRVETYEVSVGAVKDPRPIDFKLKGTDTAFPGVFRVGGDGDLIKISFETKTGKRTDEFFDQGKTARLLLLGRGQWK